MKMRMFYLLLIMASATLSSDSSQEIDKQIDELEGQIHQYRVDKMNANTKSQHYILGQPAAFSDAMKRIEEIDDQIDTLEDHLDELKAEHDKLLKEISPESQK